MAQTSQYVLRNGFSTIFWESYKPRPSTKAKAKALQEAEHLFDIVEEVRSVGKPIEIRAHCVKQTNVTDAPWSLNIVLDDDRKMTLAHCSCTGGGDGHCKHMCSLIDYINNERTETKTDTACRFNAPSARGKRLYPKGEPFDDIFQNIKKMPKHSFKVQQEENDAHLEDLLELGDNHSMVSRLLKKMKVCKV
jgi:hypothetical protein